jgi:hypothetical protein
MLGEIPISVIDSAHWINKAILYSRNNDVEDVRDEVLDSLDGKIKVSADPFSISLVHCSLFPSRVHVLERNETSQLFIRQVTFHNKD